MNKYKYYGIPALIILALLLLSFFVVRHYQNKGIKDVIKNERVIQEIWRMYDVLEDSIIVLNTELKFLQQLKKASNIRMEKSRLRLDILLEQRPKVIESKQDSVLIKIMKYL